MYYLANPRTGEVWLDSPQPIADPGSIPSEYWGELAWFKIGEREGRDIIGPLGPFGLSFFEYDGTTLTYIVAPSSFDDPADSTKNHLVESLPTFGVGIDTHTYYDTLSLPAYNPLSAPASNFPWTSFLIDTGHEAQGPDQYRKWVLPSQGSLRFELVDEDLGSRGSVRGENLIARLVRITTPFGLSASITDAKGPAVIGDSPATGHPYVPFFYIEGCAWQWNPHTVIQGSPDADWTPIGSTLSGEEVFAAVPGSTITAIYNRLRTNTETDPEESNAMTTGPDLGTHDGYATIGASSTAPAFLSMPTGAPDEWFVFRADALFALDGC